ncbi:MAG: YqeG family HAD IIIA-type phosphatase [Oscillospiraceae bacterium]|jgi:HAD superfamily phosphatase (TIGR01668 family)|nr:YqeG family HAD IIIA-type phosphatase [Oscillospiraceae bacterium]
MNILMASDICDLTPAWLKERGVRAVLADLDNTLAGYRANEPDAAVALWMAALKEAGIALMIVSNAKEERVAAFCAPLGLPYLARAGKPGGRGMLEAVKRLRMSAAETVMVGDQYFTDIRAGRKAGLRTVLVNPRIKGFWFTLRRLYETPFIAGKAEKL